MKIFIRLPRASFCYQFVIGVALGTLLTWGKKDSITRLALLSSLTRTLATLLLGPAPYFYLLSNLNRKSCPATIACV